MASSWFLRLGEAVRAPASRKRAPAGSRVAWPEAALRIEKVEQAGCAVPVGVFGDVAGFLRLVEISGAIERDDLVVGAEALERVAHVGEHLAVGEHLLLLGLGDGKSGARNLALVAIEDRVVALAKERNVVEVADVGVVDLPRDISFANGLLQLVLAVGGGHAELRCLQVGPGLQRLGLEVVDGARDRLVIE